MANSLSETGRSVKWPIREIDNAIGEISALASGLWFVVLCFIVDGSRIFYVHFGFL